jgi:hypothetical protein
VGIWRRDGERWIELLPWSASAAVRPGAARNDLHVESLGTRLTFKVNGVEVASRTIEDPGEGAVGVFAGGDLNEVVLERFAVHVPE